MKNFIWNPDTCRCKNGKYLGGIIDDSVTSCNENIDRTKSTSTKTFPTIITSTNFYISFAFLLMQ